jgi:hypothetical protein
MLPQKSIDPERVGAANIETGGNSIIEQTKGFAILHTARGIDDAFALKQTVKDIDEKGTQDMAPLFQRNTIHLSGSVIQCFILSVFP